MLGYVDFVSRNSILGWAADPNDPEAELELIVRVNGKPAGRARANQQRDYLRTLFPGATGRYGFGYEFQGPLTLFETHQVEVIVARSGQRVNNGRQVIPAVGTSPVAMRFWQSSSMAPVLITSTGRAGSSLCMARLAAHPDIVVAGEHPYEILMMTYYALVLRTLVSEGDRSRSMRPDDMLVMAHRFNVGFNPFNTRIAGAPAEMEEYWNNRLPGQLAASFGALIRDYYRATATVAGKASVRLFAEKSNPGPLVRRAARMMLGPLREIALIRDPRDLACSYRAFWKTSVEDAIVSIRAQLEHLRRLREGESSDSLFIRYEDLVLKQETTMSSIWRYLGISPPRSGADANEQAVFKRHGTSASAAASIGRWRSDLTTAEAAQCQESFSEFLEIFGYEV